MVIAHQSGVFHSTISMILKSKNKVLEAAKGSASWEARRRTKKFKMAYTGRGEAAYDLG